MDQLTLTPAVRAALPDLGRPVELVDESGKPVGYFLPHEVHRQLLVGWSEAVVPPEEVERRAAESGGGRSAADIPRDVEQGRELRR